MTPEEKIEQVVQRLASAQHITILTGAGVSAESGVPTFRGADGLWEGHRITDVATPRGWYKDPEMVWRFYHMRREKVASVHPNPGHYALMHLQQMYGDGFHLITQNIDGLHLQAGNTDVIEIHGALRRVRCTKCYRVEDRGTEALEQMPKCRQCAALVRPDIVWFEEALDPDVWHAAVVATELADVFLVIGTSAVVYPAASLIPLAMQRPQNPAYVVEINLEATDASEIADISLFGKSGEILPRLVEQLQKVKAA